MSNEHKTRAERSIELRDAAASALIDLTLCKHDSVGASSARHRLRSIIAEALALPPDPPRGDENLRELSQFVNNLRHGAVMGCERDYVCGIVAVEIDRLLSAAPKPEPSESPAEPAQDDDYRSLDHACEILRGCVAPYSGEQAHAVAKALKQWRDKWAAAVDCIHPDERQTIADLRAKLAIATRECDALKSEGDEFLAERDGAWRERDALRAKLEAAEADILKVAQAIGIVYQADYHSDVAGPTDVIVERIVAQGAKLAAAEETLRCWRDIVNEAREILGFPNSVLLSSVAKDVKDRLADAERRNNALLQMWDECLPSRPVKAGGTVDSLVAGTKLLAEQLAAAEAALVARHGGEPLALLAELDEARAKLAAAEERIAEMRKVAATFLGGTALGRMIEQEGGA